MGELIQHTAALTNAHTVALIRKRCKDATTEEFDTFVHQCRELGLDPLRNQAYLFIFNADNAKKRTPTLIVSIHGQRAIAARTGNYRPSDEYPEFVYHDEAKNADSNPLGIVECRTKVYQYMHGDWHAITGRARWDSYVPLYDGKIPATKRNWRTMPDVMIEKCAEMNALRKAWPEQFGAAYAQEEVDHMLDLTATELADEGERAERREKIGYKAGKVNVYVQWDDGAPIETFPVGELADKALAVFRDWSEEDRVGADTRIMSWARLNQIALRELWAEDKTAALEVKRAVEAAENRFAERAKMTEDAA